MLYGISGLIYTTPLWSVYLTQRHYQCVCIGASIGIVYATVYEFVAYLPSHSNALKTIVFDAYAF